METKDLGKVDSLGDGKLLVLTVGLPYSGKSTWARGTFLPIVCPDAIRVALYNERFNPTMEPYVWAIAKTMVRALFLAGHSKVVLDATNVSHERRKDWLSNDWDLRLKTFPAGVAECTRRAEAAGDYLIVPVIERMAAAFEPVEDTYSVMEDEE